MPGASASGGRNAPVRLRQGRHEPRSGWIGAKVAQRPSLVEQIEGGRPLPSHLEGAVIALGNFDGVHLGHKAVVGQAISMARERSVAMIVATFDPHPVQYFKSDAAHFGLTTLEQRRRLLRPAGVDALMVFRFDGALASVTPEAFVREWLVGTSAVVTGADFAFGCKRGGNAQLLAALGAKHGLACRTVPPVMLDGQVVSSTRVRKALQFGDCVAATRLLGRAFAVEGFLEPSAVMDRASPRATVDLGPYLRPCKGAYEVRVRTSDEQMFEGLAWVDGASARQIEFVDLDRSVFQSEQRRQFVGVEFLSRVADEVSA